MWMKGSTGSQSDGIKTPELNLHPYGYVSTIRAWFKDQLVTKPTPTPPAKERKTGFIHNEKGANASGRQMNWKVTNNTANQPSIIRQRLDTSTHISLNRQLNVAKR